MSASVTRALLAALAVVLAAALPAEAQPAFPPAPAAPVLTVGGAAPDASGNVAAAAAGLLSRTGVTDASNAAAGQVGEVQSVQITPANAITLANGAPANVASVSLSAGDWQCSSVVDFALTGATITGFQAGLSTNSATLGPQDTYIGLPLGASLLTNTITQPTPRMRLSAATPMTVYLVASTSFTLGSAKAYGTVLCRRMR